ncbi:cytochrome c oxidase cbb3-type subunit 3 [Tistlia consotensis]|uniref:Cbb3-type cytochrome c oxidase subunit n=1 Tax=Tistlia consotensis USBA 355 TaxID=560819 RepID=A0A1Y6C7N1_9PROT|nr:cytochrome-c oxidase, cbb3-type subunit III [Tistlia consotensis]SMF40454.1 cytochrome c oxidase cbb3-type subunit 3 [Tistlia consotensis USBA 355]SNR74918.1 cytochrome c oxidase cbb3-type subunit 3 [Tistlia consotensis]
MPTKIEKDAVTGTQTTGHEWDGIKELNTPLPKWWLYTFYACILWSLVYWVLYPAIPYITGATRGILGWSSRTQITEQLATAHAAQAEYLKGIHDTQLAAIPDNPKLFEFARRGGEVAFNDNCAPCHGVGGSGNPGGFPVLADDVWLWGGTLAAIQQTVTHGIRWSDDADTRVSEMPTFGEILSHDEINNVAEYVLSLSGRADDPKAAEAGAQVFTDNCAACHGDKGQGSHDVGAPRLSDAVWLYGGTKADIVSQVTKPKHGVMPAWSGRLDADTIKMLAVYVHSLGGGK